MISKTFMVTKKTILIFNIVMAAFFVFAIVVNIYQKNTSAIILMFIYTLLFIINILITINIIKIAKNESIKHNILDDIFQENLIDYKKLKQKLWYSFILNFVLFLISIIMTSSVIFVMKSNKSYIELESVNIIINTTIILFTLISISALINFIVDIKAIRKINREN